MLLSFYTVSHFIHRIRRETGPLTYESYFLKEFNLGEAGERDQFRERLNDIQVLHVTVFNEVVKKAVEEVLALEQPEINHRLKERTHKGVGFEVALRDGVEGIIVKRDVNDSPLPIFASQDSLFEEPAKNEERRTNMSSMDKDKATMY